MYCIVFRAADCRSKNIVAMLLLEVLISCHVRWIDCLVMVCNFGLVSTRLLSSVIYV